MAEQSPLNPFGLLQDSTKRSSRPGVSTRYIRKVLNVSRPLRRNEALALCRVNACVEESLVKADVLVVRAPNKGDQRAGFGRIKDRQHGLFAVVGNMEIDFEIIESFSLLLSFQF
jgi:hypothetical protein